ncbi:hypothetical protein [Vibrio porteresiae]|uniref:Uncharacterized protein n=1 Tax=Vibrio porteresiae DSM 19223 TaxID=1123496 RepID=A0ABZ0Q7J7_9VIBR|nr:hypothetical protein [Vibrio porteresiae]WPC72398.1 hypothetical protein R8Z52_09630 [Vibrio porteresiae DSM 19223]
MKLSLSLGIVLILTATPALSLVQLDASTGSATFLIQSCREYIELYNKKEERFGAFLTTSKDESFRAGYCLGAIEHADMKCRWGEHSMYKTAELIAKSSPQDYYGETVLLETALCR